MKKLKLNTFRTLSQTAHIHVGDKTVKLKEERDLFSRFLIIHGSRPGLVPKMEETIGEYEMSVVPRSLFAADGSLLIPQNKHKMMTLLEQFQSENPAPSITTTSSSKVLIIDAMAFVHPLKKSPATRTLRDLQDVFISKIENRLQGFDEGRVVFDTYLDTSLKDKTRAKRSSSNAKEFKLHTDMILNMSMKDLMSSSRNKRQLTIIFAKGLIQHFIDKIIKLHVVYDDKIVGADKSEEKHSHEEADTLIPQQVIASAAESPDKEIHVLCQDTDVFTYLLDLVATEKINKQTSLKLHAGKGFSRVIDIRERVHVLGEPKCRGLVGFHHFTGADWGGKFVGKSKEAWTKAYLALCDEDPALQCFRKLGEENIQNELIEARLPAEWRPLERFVCKVYSQNGPLSIPKLRWELFRTKNLEGEMLPPTLSSLLPHIRRTNYMAKVSKSYKTACPELPQIEENGWSVESNTYSPIRCLALPAPKAVIELTKCSCRVSCSGNCGCSRNNLPCTPLCKCYSSGCSNTTSLTNSLNLDDDDDEDGEL